MPGILAFYATFKTLWNESKPLRHWFWGKLPIVKDVRRREVVEGYLAKLLDDVNKLAQSLPGQALEETLTGRMDLFRKDIAREGIVGEEANELVERATVLARLYVTGPLGDVIDLRYRLAEDEEAFRQAERRIESLESRNEKMEQRVALLESLMHRAHLFMGVGVAMGALGLVVALVALAVHR